MRIKGIFIFKQKLQIATIAIVKRTWGLMTSARGIISRNLTLEEEYVIKRTQEGYVVFIY